MKSIMLSAFSMMLLFMAVGNYAYACELGNSEECAVYMENEEDGGISPHIVVSREIGIWITYEGTLETVPNTRYYSGYDDDYKTTMSGTLYKRQVNYDYNKNITKVYYFGTVTGTI